MYINSNLYCFGSSKHDRLLTITHHGKLCLFDVVVDGFDVPLVLGTTSIGISTSVIVYVGF